MAVKLSRRQSEAGFTLVEVLVAFTILALSMIVLFEGLTTAFRREAGSQVREDLLRVARGQLDAAGVIEPFQFGTSRGILAGGYSWSMTVKPYESVTVSNPILPTPVWIEVVVANGSRGADSSIRLQTLRLLK